ncbi:MAG: polymer-forming cytoskeletal protein [Balneolaceae bacterium]|nr:polymer-forming cytoskeletal protein [Balneolaceae bacterium]
MTSKDSYIYFDKDTSFTGEVESSRIVLEGRIQGVVYAEKQLHLKEGSFIEGEIYAGHLIADEGSSCFGELQVNNGVKEVTKWKSDKREKKGKDKDGNRSEDNGRDEHSQLLQVESSVTA